MIYDAGTTSAAANDFNLTIYGAPPSQQGLFFYGTAPSSTPLGNGIRCIGDSSWRIGAAVEIDENGRAERWVDNQHPPVPEAQIAAGTTFYFQFWYRDPAAGGAGFNLSDALKAAFCP